MRSLIFTSRNRRPSAAGAARLLILLTFLGLGWAGEGRACRFWGLVGGRYPRDLIADHLKDGSVANLKELGGSNRDGWGFGIFLRPSSQSHDRSVLLQRGRPPTTRTIRSTTAR
jgi:hypothetical protein